MTNFKEEYAKLFRFFVYLIITTVFLSGVILATIAREHHEFYWVAIEHFGIFISVSVAVTFLYEHFVRDKDRKIFLSDLQNTMRVELSKSESKKLLEKGRRSLEKKVAFISPARKEIIELGEKLNSFTGYFDSISSHGFKDHVRKLLGNGVNIICVISDPNSEIVKQYSKTVEALPNSLPLQEVNESIQKLQALQTEFSAYTGKIKLYLYNGILKYHLSAIDLLEPDGKMYVSNYLNGIKRADCPGIEIYKGLNEEAFKQYYNSFQNILANSKEI